MLGCTLGMRDGIAGAITKKNVFAEWSSSGHVQQCYATSVLVGDLPLISFVRDLPVLNSFRCV